VAAAVHPSLLGYTLLASAEVSRLAGAHRQAAATLHRALRIYENAQAHPLADRTRAALASLTNHTGTAAVTPIGPAGQ
jgi:hypothetical protein